MIAWRARRIPKRCAMTANCRQNLFGIVLETMADERVGIARGESIGRKQIGRKVPQVPGYDLIGTPYDRRGQYMAVVGVGQFKHRSEAGVARHDRFGKVSVHRHARPIERMGGKVGPVGEKAPHPFRMDVGTPSRAVEIPIRQTKQEVPKAGRVEDIGVEQRRRAGHRLLQAEFLVAGRQFVERLAATGFRRAAIGEDVLGANAPVCAHLAEGNSSAIE